MTYNFYPADGRRHQFNAEQTDLGSEAEALDYAINLAADWGMKVFGYISDDNQNSVLWALPNRDGHYHG